MTTDIDAIHNMRKTAAWKTQMKEVLKTGIERVCKSCGGTVSHGYLILASGYCLPCKKAGLEYYREEEAVDIMDSGKKTYKAARTLI